MRLPLSSVSYTSLTPSTAIRIHILSGRVETAQSLLRAHFPNVLQHEDELGGSLHGRASSPIPPLPRKPAPHDRVPYASQTSCKPIHIALNLRILDFIEAARTVPLPYAGDTLRSSSSLSTTSTSAYASLYDSAI